MNILIVRTDFLGDSVLSSTFIQMLRQLPDVNLDILCYEYNYPAFKYNPQLENKYCLFKNAASTEEREHNNSVFRRLEQNSYDVTFMLNRDLKTYKLLKHVNTSSVFGHKLGVKSLRSKMFCALTALKSKYNYLPYANEIHEVINQFNLLNFAVAKLKINATITLEPRCYFFTETFNPEQTGIRDSTTVVLNISGRLDSLKYIPSCLARCIIEDLFKLDKKVLIIATRDDVSRAKEIIAELKDSRVNVCAETDLFMVADTMAHYMDYIGADGGLLHIAAGLHMRCIGLFNAQNIQAWHPWSPQQICLQTASKKIYDLTAAEIITAFNQLRGNDV